MMGRPLAARTIRLVLVQIRLGIEGDQQQLSISCASMAGPLHNDDGFAWKMACPLPPPRWCSGTGNSAGSPRSAGKTALALQIGDVLVGEVRLSMIWQNCSSPAAMAKPPSSGILRKNIAKHADLVGVALLKIARGHGQLVKIHQKRVRLRSWLILVINDPGFLSVWVYCSARGRLVTVCAVRAGPGGGHGARPLSCSHTRTAVRIR